MKEKSTDELNKQLENTKPQDIKKYYKENIDSLNSKKSFYYYVKDVLAKKNIILKDVYIASGLGDSYGGQLIRMEKVTKNRDVIIKICLAGHFLLDEINTALKLYGMIPLYAKDQRDACIIVAVNNRIYDIDEIDEILKEHNFESLSKDE